MSTNSNDVGTTDEEKKPRDPTHLLLLESTIQYSASSQEGAIEVIYNTESDLVEALFKIEIISKQIISNSKAYFSVKPMPDKTGSVIGCTRIGRLILFHSWAHAYCFFQHYPQHQFSPYAELFFDVFMAPDFLSQLSEINPLISHQRKINHDLAATHVARLNEQVAMFRRETTLPQFKRGIKSIQRVSNKNQKSLSDYFKQLFDHHGKMLVIRMDLSYSEKEVQRQQSCIHRYITKNDLGNMIPSRDPAPSYSKSDTQSTQPTGFLIEDVIQHRESFIAHLRKTFKSALKGYAWKLEYGYSKGYHYHLVIFLDGSKYQQDVTIGKILGSHWNQEITGGLGLYFNCNAIKRSYRHCAVGMQVHSDPELWSGLSKVVEYLTKPDLYVKLNLPSNKRTFGKGGGLPKSGAPKQGRPRVKESIQPPPKPSKRRRSDPPLESE